MKKDIFLVFLLLLFFILIVYWVGTASDALISAKIIQQVAYFLTGRDPATGSWSQGQQTKAPETAQQSAYDSLNTVANDVTQWLKNTTGTVSNQIQTDINNATKAFQNIIGGA